MANAFSWKSFLAGAALTALAAAALGPCARAETTPPAAPVAPATPPRRETPDTRTEPRRARGPKARPEKTDEPAAVEDAPPPATPVAEATAQDEFPGVDVEVVFFDGRPAADSDVYALPAGADWKYGDADPPRARTDEAGRARLRVLRSGRYDVGANWGSLYAFAIDADVPSPAVRVTLPQGAEIAVVFDGPAPEKNGDQLRFAPEARDAVPYPGRRQTYDWTSNESIEPGTTRLTWTAPRGTAVLVSSPRRKYRLSPSRVVAPAEVRAVVEELVPARLRFAFDPPTAAFAHPYVVRLEILGDDADADPIRWWAPYEAGEAVGLPDDFRFEVAVHAPAGALHWKGEGVLPGSATYQGLTPDGENTITLPIRVARDAPRPTPEETGEARGPQIRRAIHVKGDGDAGATLVRYLLGEGDESLHSETDDTLEMQRARFAMARRGEWIAGPVDIGAQEDGVVELTLRRGGRLVVVPEGGLPPETLGELTLERKDGRPTFSGDPENPELSLRASLRPGAVLGPLPEGPVAFVVRIGDEIVAEASAVVRAGGYEPLKIPKIRGR